MSCGRERPSILNSSLVPLIGVDGVHVESAVLGDLALCPFLQTATKSKARQPQRHATIVSNNTPIHSFLYSHTANHIHIHTNTHNHSALSHTQPIRNYTLLYTVATPKPHAQPHRNTTTTTSTTASATFSSVTSPLSTLHNHISVKPHAVPAAPAPPSLPAFPYPTRPGNKGRWAMSGGVGRRGRGLWRGIQTVI